MSQYEDSVAAKIQARAEHGLNKYGVTVARGDLDDIDWLRHAQEEAMDLAVYLERLIQDREVVAIQEPPPPAIQSPPEGPANELKHSGAPLYGIFVALLLGAIIAIAFAAALS